MYTVIRSYVMVNKKWFLKDIQDETLEFILREYQSSRIVIRWGASEEEEIRISTILATLSQMALLLTVKEWVETLNKDSVKTNSPSSLSSAKNVKFTDLYTYPYEVKRGSHVYAEGVPIPPGMDVDIRLDNDLPEHDEKSMMNTGKNMVICVKGRLLNTVYAHGSVYGVSGSKNAGIENTTTLSILDFTDVGGCTKIPLTLSNVKVVKEESSTEDDHKTRVVITSPVSLVDKTPMVALDGKLKYKPSQVKVINGNQLLLTIDNRAVVEDLLERQDKSPSWVNHVTVNKAGYELDSLNVPKLLTETGSFVILVNNNELCVNEEAVSGTGITGCYRHYRVPTGLVVDERGNILPYHLDGYTDTVVALNVGHTTDKIVRMTDSNSPDDLIVSSVEEVKTRRVQKKATCVDFYIL